MPVGKRSYAHPRRDRFWEKVRQSEANLVTGIRSTPDGPRSPLSGTRGRVHVAADSGQVAEFPARCYSDRKSQIARSIEDNNSCHCSGTRLLRKHLLRSNRDNCVTLG